MLDFFQYVLPPRYDDYYAYNHHDHYAQSLANLTSDYATYGGENNEV